MLQRFLFAVLFTLGGIVSGLFASPQVTTDLRATNAAAQSSAEADLILNDIFYDQREITIAADTGITFHLSNEGVVLHNFSIPDLGIDVDVEPGTTLDVVVTAPDGIYEYFCSQPGHREAGMVGRLIADAGLSAAPEVEQVVSSPEATISALQTQVAELEAGSSTETPVTSLPTPTVATGEMTQPEGGEANDVNIEIILDVSGSMGQVLDTGETRMDAAKRVLNDVLTAIPDREGINVGLRIYGHQGDNTEAGQAVSCQSSDLIVDVDGVNRARLGEEIAALQPTGWTPIALSLEEAEGDFPTDQDDAVNAVVLVTDGLETCGGDPAAAAATLRDGEVHASTHVIGFALTQEEQQMLSGIADEGEGLLLGAANADELTLALFSVLEELEIVVGRGYVGGNAFPLIPMGDSGELSIVGVGSLDTIGRLPFVLRNNTSTDVLDVKVAVIVRDGAGNLAGRADSLEVRPHFVPVGGVAFGYAYFGGINLPADAQFELEAEATPADIARFNIFRDLDIDEASLFEDRVVGVATNGHDGPVAGPLGFGVICFDLDGNILGGDVGTANTSDLEPNASEEFQVTVNSWAVGGAGCPAFLVAGSGIAG